MIERVSDLDLHFSKMIVGLRLHPRLRTILKFFVRIGDGWFWIPVVCCIFLEKSLPDFVEITRHCLTALGISLSFYWLLKRTVRRLRPFQRLPAATAELSPLDQFSFPSGHTMNNLAIGLVIGHYFPLLLWPMVLLPIMWGLFRVHFGLHFVSDILAGGLLAVFSFELSRLILAKRL